jgi:hypothetical protein
MWSGVKWSLQQTCSWPLINYTNTNTELTYLHIDLPQPSPPPTQVVLGCVWAAIMNRLLLPWFTSDWAAEELAGALTAAAGLTRELYALNYSRMALINNQEQQQGQGQGQQQQQQQQQQHGQQRQQQQQQQQQPQQQQRHAPRLAATAAELAAWEAELLQQISAGVSGRVVGVTSSLARDVVSWRRGPWVTPRVSG